MADWSENRWIASRLVNLFPPSLAVSSFRPLTRFDQARTVLTEMPSRFAAPASVRTVSVLKSIKGIILLPACF